MMDFFSHLQQNQLRLTWNLEKSVTVDIVIKVSVKVGK